MAAKTKSLAEAISAASKKPATPTLVPAAPRPQEAKKTPAAQVKASRIGKKPITGFFDPAVSRQIKQLALDEDSSIQDLIGEALNDLFEKRGKKPIA